MQQQGLTERRWEDGTDEGSIIGLNCAIVHGLIIHSQTTVEKLIILNWAVKQDTGC